LCREGVDDEDEDEDRMEELTSRGVESCCCGGLVVIVVAAAALRGLRGGVAAVVAVGRIGGTGNDRGGVETLERATLSLVDDSVGGVHSAVAADALVSDSCNCCTKKNNLRLSCADDTPKAA
jgi:hypothetical protein